MLTATNESGVELGSGVIWDHRPRSGRAGWQVRDAAGRGPPSMLGRSGPMAVLAGSLETPTQAADGRVAQLPGSGPCPALMVAAASFGRSCERPWGAAPQHLLDGSGWTDVGGADLQGTSPYLLAGQMISPRTRSGLRSQSPAPALRASQPQFPLKVEGLGGSEFVLEKAFALCLACQLFSLEG